MAAVDVAQPIGALRFGRFRTLVDAEFRTTGQITVVCGPNNSGKSSLLDALEAWAALRGSTRGKDVGADAKELAGGGIEVGLDLWSERFDSLVAGAASNPAPKASARDWFVEQLGLAPGDLWWVPLVEGRAGALLVDKDFIAAVQPHVTATSTQSTVHRRLAQQIRNIPGTGSNALSQAWFERVLAELTASTIDIRRIHDVRRSSDRALQDDALASLAVAAAPTTHDPPRKRERWARDLESVLQRVFGTDTRYQAVPSGAGSYQLLLSLDGQTDVPVEHVGAGVREVIAIAYTALSKGGADVLCIEEPENCLHPTAARRLIRALADLTNTQIVATTHSAAVVNSEPDTIIEVERDGSSSSTRVVANAADRFSAARALGHSPADLVLAHCALWVEGPSDRLYLTHWLRTSAGLVEGDDYTVMYFGGSLGATVGIQSDPSGNLYAQVRPLCRRCVILADSDRAKKGDSRKKHVLRWIREAEDDSDALVATTDYREIENCAPRAAVNSVRAEYGLRPLTEAEYPYARVVPANKRINKSDFAVKVIAKGAARPHSAAAPMLERIAAFIRESRVR